MSQCDKPAYSHAAAITTCETILSTEVRCAIVMAYFQGGVPSFDVGCCVDGAAMDVAEELHDKTCRIV